MTHVILVLDVSSRPADRARHWVDLGLEGAFLQLLLLSSLLCCHGVLLALANLGP